MNIYAWPYVLNLRTSFQQKEIDMTQELLNDLIALNAKHNDAGVADLIEDIKFELTNEYENNLQSGHMPITDAEMHTVWNKSELGLV